MIQGLPDSAFLSYGDVISRDGDAILAQSILQRIGELMEGGGAGHVDLNQQRWRQFCQTHRRPSTDFKRFFSQYQDLFDLAEQGDGSFRVNAKIDLGLCKEHCSKGGCSQLTCEGLHCCKFFLHDKCKFKNKCEYGHDLNTSHNKLLLHQHCLDLLEPRQLGAILKLSTKATTLLPKICKYYNVTSGCRSETGEDKKRCRAMHVCKHYVLGDCSYGHRCKKSHNIFDRQPKAILRKHGINVKRSPKDVLVELRTALKEKDEDEEEGADGLDAEDSGSDVSDLEAPFAACSVNPRGYPKFDEVCIFNLRGKCSYGKKCERYHSPAPGLPYQWQYESEAGDWLDFKDPSNSQLERNFCDVDTDECVATDFVGGRSMRINFIGMTYTSLAGSSGDLRRLTTKAQFDPSSTLLYMTLWRWYWKNTGGEWIPYGPNISAQIEKMFEDASNRFIPYPNYILDLENMEQKGKDGKVAEMRRRPAMFDPSTKRPVEQESQSNDSDDEDD